MRQFFIHHHHKSTSLTSLSILIICLLPFIRTQTTHPWNAALPSQQNIRSSEYTDEVKFANGAFFNNIGDYQILSQQIQNFTSITNSQLAENCTVNPYFMGIVLPASFVLLLLITIGTQTEVTECLHIIEFAQELFIIITMNIVRDPCLYEYFLIFKTSFFVFSSRSRVLRNTNYLKRIFFQSAYFLENTSEIGIAVSFLLFVYMLIATFHYFMYQPKSLINQRVQAVLAWFEFGFFFRMIQVFILPLTYFTFRGMIVPSFSSNTIVFDFFMCTLYSIIILTMVGLCIYIINFAEIDMANKATLAAYGSLYSHVRYKEENKMISNEFTFRLILKVFIGSFHSFGFFNSYNIGIGGMVAYGIFCIYILISFRLDGLYEQTLNDYKMFGFHFLMLANYTFAVVQIDRTNAEVLVVWFFQILFNSICLFVLFMHAIYSIIRAFQKRSKESKIKKNQYGRVSTNDLNSDDVSDYDVKFNFVFNLTRRMLI